MQAFKSLVSCRFQFSRSFSTTSSNAKTLYQTEEYAFNYRGPGPKIFGEKEFYKQLFKKRKNYNAAEIPLGAPSISLLTATQTFVSGRATATNKRIAVLNKLFMRYIPEVISTSEMGSKLFGYDVEFSHVNVSSQCNMIHVYWIPKGTDDDEVIQKLLVEIASPLRIELNNLKLLGSVPPIRFLKNKFHALMVEVDRRLKIADFGEDFVPTVISSNILQGQLQLQMNLPNEIKHKISKLEAGEHFDNEEINILPIRTDTCGLNREKIVKSICMAKKKDNLNHLASQNEELILGSSAIKQVSFSTEAQPSQTWDRKAFVQYMTKERFKRKKMLKELAKDFHKQLLEDVKLKNDEEEEDDLFVEFVTNAFTDIVEDSDEELNRLSQGQ